MKNQAQMNLCNNSCINIELFSKIVESALHLTIVYAFEPFIKLNERNLIN